MPSPSRDVLDALVDMLADRVAEKLAARAAAAAETPQTATSKRNPLGSSRAFLDAARTGKFPSFKRGREVVARWQDVEAYEAARWRPRTVQGHPSDAARVTILRQRGVVS